ncbi:MAG TPA: hypothetical protein VIM37_01775 [Candidatus Microsaccharimonas sp.]|jgi:hypothetical protein
MMTAVTNELGLGTMRDITELVQSIQSQHPPSDGAISAEIHRIAKHAGRSDGDIANLAFKQLCRRATGSSLQQLENEPCYQELVRLRDTL